MNIDCRFVNTKVVCGCFITPVHMRELFMCLGNLGLSLRDRQTELPTILGIKEDFKRNPLVPIGKVRRK